MPISSMMSASAATVSNMTAAKVGRDCITVSSATAASNRPISAHTARSSLREKRAGSVTMRTNQSPTAEDRPGNTKVA